MTVKAYIQSLRYGQEKVDLTSFFIKNETHSKELIHLALSEEAYPMPEYASWKAVHVQKLKKDIWFPYHVPIVDQILKTKNQTVLRNLLNLLQNHPISTYKEGELIDFLFQNIQNDDFKVAVHVYSIYLLFPFFKVYPELIKELEAILTLKTEKGKVQPALKIAIRNFEKIKNKSK